MALPSYTHTSNKIEIAQAIRPPSITRLIDFFLRLISTVFGLWNCPLSSPLPMARFRFRQSLSRDASAFHISRLVTGLVTANGDSRAANSENTGRRHGSTLRSGWKLHHDTRKQNHQHATTTRENTQEQSDTKNPSP